MKKPLPPPNYHACYLKNRTIIYSAHFKHFTRGTRDKQSHTFQSSKMYLKDTSKLDRLTLKIQIATCPAAYTTSYPFIFAAKHQSACSSVRLFLHTKNLYMCTPSSCCKPTQWMGIGLLLPRHYLLLHILLAPSLLLPIALLVRTCMRSLSGL
jgi:hypothetical protein